MNEKDGKMTGITISMNSRTNHLLEVACKEGNRSKKKEVELRLADHLNRYDCSSVQLAEVIIGKHRNGAIGHVNLTFRGDLCRFENHEYDFVGLR